MKLFIVKNEKEYKIVRVEQEQENVFRKEHGKRVLVEGNNLGEVINKFQDLNPEKMSISPQITGFNQKRADELDQSSLKRRQRWQ